MPDSVVKPDFRCGIFFRLEASVVFRHVPTSGDVPELSCCSVGLLNSTPSKTMRVILAMRLGQHKTNRLNTKHNEN